SRLSVIRESAIRDARRYQGPMMPSRSMASHPRATCLTGLLLGATKLLQHGDGGLDAAFELAQGVVLVGGVEAGVGQAEPGHHQLHAERLLEGGGYRHRPAHAEQSGLLAEAALEGAVGGADAAAVAGGADRRGWGDCAYL